LTNKKFNIWVQKYCNFIGAKYIDGNTNGMRWFTIKTNNVEQVEDDDIAF